MFPRKIVVFLATATVVVSLGLMPAQQPAGAESKAPGVATYLCPMHPEIQSAKPGRCNKCPMGLVEVPPGKSSYICPAHPGSEHPGPGACLVCGAALVPAASLPAYRVDLQTNPQSIRAGTPTTLRLAVTESASGKIVERFEMVHEKLLHLFIISQDLANYQHIHPLQQPDGTFVVETTLPEEGRYYVISDFYPVGGWPQVARRTLETEGHASMPQNVVARLTPETTLRKVVDGIDFKLTMDPVQAAAGMATALNFELTDPRTGNAVADLQPYLGAWGHTVILHEDGRDYVHSHPRNEAHNKNGQPSTVVPPIITFDSFFPRPGRYRLWLQVQRQHEVTTVSFDVAVASLNAIATWNGNDWSGLDPVGNSINGAVRALAVSGSDVYAGGDFTHAGTLRVNRIMRWNGREWSALGEGVNGAVWAIAANGNDVYVAGEFTAAGGAPAHRVAKWNGREWSPLGEGVTGCRDVSCSPAVYALAASGPDLYVGGRFSKAGTKPANGIAKWSITNGWEPLEAGVQTGVYDGVVRALATSGGSVYVGGSFKTAGTTVANNIALWDGSTWQTLGSGIGGGLEQVLAIGLQKHEVYAGGDFNTAGGIRVSNLAVWNGQRWSDIGITTDAPVHAIALNETELYIAGSRFTLPSGTIAQGVITRRGTWAALGAGLGNDRYLAPVLALSVAGNDVYAAGGPFAISDTEPNVDRQPVSRTARAR